MSSCLTEDPDKLLNEWLGELENLIGVSWSCAPQSFDMLPSSSSIFNQVVRQLPLIIMLKSSPTRADWRVFKNDSI